MSWTMWLPAALAAVTPTGGPGTCSGSLATSSTILPRAAAAIGAPKNGQDDSSLTGPVQQVPRSVSCTQSIANCSGGLMSPLIGSVAPRCGATTSQQPLPSHHRRPVSGGLSTTGGRRLTHTG